MTTIEIQNLKCDGCANTVAKGMKSIKGISKVFVNVETSKVTFNAATLEAIDTAKTKLSRLGYPEIHANNTTLHKAISYVSCATGKIGAES
jgi:copper chaperone CopZ